MVLGNNYLRFFNLKIIWIYIKIHMYLVSIKVSLGVIILVVFYFFLPSPSHAALLLAGGAVSTDGSSEDVGPGVGLTSAGDRNGSSYE